MKVNEKDSKKVYRCLIFEVREGPNKREYGGLAQLGERLLCKQEVSGSIPLISTSRGSCKLSRLWANSSAG